MHWPTLARARLIGQRYLASSSRRTIDVPVPRVDLGYARVSTVKQDLDRQLHALAEAGVPAERIFVGREVGLDHIVGDDWRIAVAVVAALAITFGIARTAVPAWWVLPATVAVLLPLSLWRVARTRRPGPARTVEDVDRLP